MLILCQNIMKSLLDEKSIVFEKRAQAEKEEKEKVVEKMSGRIGELEAELKHARNRCQLAENKATELKGKLNMSLDQCDILNRDLEQKNEIIKIKDKQGAQFAKAGNKLGAEREAFTKQIDGLRDGAAIAVRELRPALLSAQEGALLCATLDVIPGGKYKAFSAQSIADMLPVDPESFKLPNAPAHDLRPLMLKQRISSLKEVVTTMSTKLLQTTVELTTAQKRVAAAEQAGFESALTLQTDPAFIVPRDELLASREMLRSLRNFTVEPKHPEVVRAFLILTGAPKKKIDKWHDVKKHLGPEVYKSLLHMDYEDKKFASLCKDAHSLLKDLNRDEVLANSDAVGCMLKMVEGIFTAKENIDAAKKAAEEKATALAEAALAAGEEAEAP